MRAAGRNHRVVWDGLDIRGNRQNHRRRRALFQAAAADLRPGPHSEDGRSLVVVVACREERELSEAEGLHKGGRHGGEVGAFLE